MDLIKRKLDLRINIIIILILLNGCAGKNDDKHKPVLECLIENFISVYSLNSNDTIFISDYQGWSDNTSNIILNVKSSDEKVDLTQSDALYAKISNIEVYLILGNLRNEPIDSSKIISNNIKWQKAINTENDNYAPNQNPNDGIELQLVYNSSKKVIEKILKVSNPNSSNKDINYEIFKKCGQ